MRPNHDMALWGLQYIDDGNTNTLRIARAIGAAGIAGNSWTYWNFTPQITGFPNGVWFDYPSFTVSTNYLYVTTNAFNTSNNLFHGNVVFRILLSELAAGGAVNYSYFRSNIGTERLTEGAGTTMYWGGFTTTTQMRIHRWADGAGNIFWDNINLAAFNYLNRNGVATSPDGTNWAARADSRPTAAYVAGGVLGFMWTARQGTGRPFPYTVHARFSEATRALLTQSDIWHTDYAWMYPAVMPNSDGHLGGSLQIGGAASGTFAYPGTQIWVTDDVTGASNTVGALYFASAGNDGPNNNGWGDYFSIRRHKMRPRTWVSSSHALFGGGAGSNAVPRYLWFGREHDNPIKAAMTSPAPGSVLPGSSVNFMWNTGAYATQDLALRRHDGRRVLQHLESGSGSGHVSCRDGHPDQFRNGVRKALELPDGHRLGVHRLHVYGGSATCVCGCRDDESGAWLNSVEHNGAVHVERGLGQYAVLAVRRRDAGGPQIFNENQGTNLSRTVTGIPINGLPTYVRLWSFCGSWTFVDYTYQTQARTARMISPARRSVLAGATPTFTWKAGIGSTQYWLQIGNARGGVDIWNENQGVGLTRTVAGVPVDGRRIYVRLWSLLAGVWNYVDYEYTAAGTTRARLSSPAEGSAFTSTGPTINWSAGSGATQYWVFLGTSQGANNLLNQNMGTATTVTAAGLPTDRRPIYLRLWSFVGGAWVYNDYVFRAYDGGSVKARLTSPIPEQPALTGTSAVLHWNAGSGATQYLDLCRHDACCCEHPEPEHGHGTVGFGGRASG